MWHRYNIEIIPTDPYLGRQTVLSLYHDDGSGMASRMLLKIVSLVVTRGVQREYKGCLEKVIP